MPTTRAPSPPTPIVVTCADGYPLSAHIHRNPHPHSPCKGGILLAPATGFKQTFYFNFAAWLAEQGYVVLTFDNRGIGQSQNNLPLAKQPANLIDWGQLDCPAALDTLHDHLTANHSKDVADALYLIGHSAGAQLIGLMPNYHKIKRFVLIGASSGYFGNLSPKTYLQAKAVFNIWMPISNQLLGYASTATIGFGQNLPKNVATQWRKWCSSPGYMANDFGDKIKQHHYDDIIAPTLCLVATDDHIATPKNVADFTRSLPNAQLETRFVQPSDIQLTSIGHSDWFRRRCSAYWPEIAAWLEQLE